MSITDEEKRERKREYDRAWRAKNIDIVRERSRKWISEWRKDNPEEAREQYRLNHKKHRKQRRGYSKRWYEEHKNEPDFAEKRKIIGKRYYVNNKLKSLARTAVNHAIRDGKLVKPDICSECGNKGDIQGHHDDYEKALHVEWLCRKCHMNKHYQAVDELNKKLATLRDKYSV